MRCTAGKATEARAGFGGFGELAGWPLQLDHEVSPTWGRGAPVFRTTVRRTISAPTTVLRSGIYPGWAIRFPFFAWCARQL